MKKRMVLKTAVVRAALVAVLATPVMGAPSAGVEPAESFPWSVSVGPGYMNFEGDQWAKDGFYLQGRLGYEMNERMDLEGTLFFAPSLDANEPDNRAERPDWSSTWLLGAGVEGIFHLTRWQRFDPFFAAGLHATLFGDEQKNGDKADVAIRIGGGAFYHFDEEWALRVDARMALGGLGKDSEANALIEGGLCWTWGARIPVQYMVAGGSPDSDADGLTDAEETGLYKTDPHNPDSDGDGLTDYEEVKGARGYRTDPLNPDTDADLLKDGAEVLIVKSNPLDPDTDKGGVTDGHEVIEDGTDPLYKPDDLIRFSLNLNFDYDKAIIKPVYFDDLDVIGKTMTREHPGSTAKIEGHADKLKGSRAKYNRDLSERRAKSVLDYLNEKHGIARDRMTAAGYGFDKPAYPNDPVKGNPRNRRVDIYVRPVDHPVSERALPVLGAGDIMPPPAEEPEP